MEDEKEVDVVAQIANYSTGDCCYCRRDSGISMGEEDERPYQNQDLAETCCCDGSQMVREEALFFEDNIDEALPIDESMVGLALRDKHLATESMDAIPPILPTRRLTKIERSSTNGKHI
jgi:hypothetical protein